MADSGVIPNDLRPKQRRAILAMLSPEHRTIADAAGAAGVGERTLVRWLSEDVTFRAELRAAELAVLDACGRRLLSTLDTALDCLIEIVKDPDAPVSVRARAAADLLDRCLTWRQAVDLEARLIVLELAAARDETDT